MERGIFLNNSYLILIAFSSVFYARIIATTLRLPILNLLHFIIIPVVCAIVLFTTKIKAEKQIKICQHLMIGLFILLIASLASAAWNDAGLINALISFMMLGEPFIFLLTICSVPITSISISKIKGFLYFSVFTNFILAALQKPLIDLGYLNAGEFNGTDGCGGVFFLSGAGNYVSASVSFTFSLYLANCHKVPFRVKVLVFLASLWHVLFSDSKQLVFAYGIAWLILIFVNSKDILKSFYLLISFVVTGFIGLWLVQNVDLFKGFTSWARPELYEPNGLAWYAKFYSINLIQASFNSEINWLVGLGPGHSVSRLGAWFLRDYANLLNPLGATTTPIGQQSLDFVTSFWLTSGSSLFSPIFGWAGIWGDLGLLGLSAYLYLDFIVWKFFAEFDTIKLMLLGIFVIGFIFTQMEEPGFMIFTAFVLGLSQRERKKNFYLPKPSQFT
jgi:hypothetical protein